MCICVNEAAQINTQKHVEHFFNLKTHTQIITFSKVPNKCKKKKKKRE